MPHHCSNAKPFHGDLSRRAHHLPKNHQMPISITLNMPCPALHAISDSGHIIVNISNTIPATVGKNENANRSSFFMLSLLYCLLLFSVLTRYLLAQHLLRFLLRYKPGDVLFLSMFLPNTDPKLQSQTTEDHCTKK